MFVIDVFNVDPLYLEVALEFEGVILPPEGEGLLVVAGFQPGHAFKHTTFDCAEEEVGVGIVVEFALPELLYFVFIFGGGGPDAVLDGLSGGRCTLWTLSSLALRMTMPRMLWEWGCSEGLTVLRWGKVWKMESQSL